MNTVNFTYRCNLIRGALCALLIGTIAPAFSQWVQVPSGTTSYLKDIFFLNDSKGYAVGGGDSYGFPNDEQAVVLRSLDGGSTWSTVLQDTGIAFTEVAAKGDTVICLGRSMAVPSLLWITFDNGDTWQCDTLSVLGVQDLSFIGGDLLFLSYQNLVHFNLDTHAAQTLFIPNTVSIYGLDGEKIYLMTTHKSVHSGADNGLSWDTIPCYMADSIGMWTESDGEILYASGDTIAINLSYTPVFTYTMDHGQNWISYGTPFGGNVEYVSLDRMYGYSASSSTGAITISNDRGVNVNLQQQFGVPISKVFFLPQSDHGWACGGAGAIFTTTNGGLSTGSLDKLAMPPMITVQPNPVHGQVRVVVPIGMRVESMELLDSTLKVVKRFSPSARKLDITEVPTGSYLLQVGTDRGIQIIHLVVQGIR